MPSSQTSFSDVYLKDTKLTLEHVCPTSKEVSPLFPEIFYALSVVAYRGHQTCLGQQLCVMKKKIYCNLKCILSLQINNWYKLGNMIVHSEVAALLLNALKLKQKRCYFLFFGGNWTMVVQWENVKIIFFPVAIICRCKNHICNSNYAKPTQLAKT